MRSTTIARFEFSEENKSIVFKPNLRDVSFSGRYLATVTGNFGEANISAELITCDLNSNRGERGGFRPNR